MIKYWELKVKECFELNILAIGDIVGKVGIDKLAKEIKGIVEEKQIDFIIVNGENSADGMGITEKEYKEILKLNADIITLGNHTWAKKDVFKFINEPYIIRPANYPSGVPGVGYKIMTCNNKKIAIINLLGRAEIGILTENPFICVDKIIEKIKNDVDIIMVDFHAEASAEKKAMGYHLDGKATVMFGTHTHIQTADEQILPKGTGYITDIGMTGPKDSVIGMEIGASLKRFVTTLPEKYKIASGEAILNGCVFKINDENCRVESIKRVSC